MLIALDLLAWAQALVLDGELRLAEPKRLRHHLLHAAGRLARSGRRTRLRLADWRWAKALVAAFRRLRALPPGAPTVTAGWASPKTKSRAPRQHRGPYGLPPRGAGPPVAHIPRLVSGVTSPTAPLTRVVRRAQPR